MQGITQCHIFPVLASSIDQLRTILKEYKKQGVRRVVAICGDLPSGYGANSKSVVQFEYANELIEFTRSEMGGLVGAPSLHFYTMKQAGPRARHSEQS